MPASFTLVVDLTAPQVVFGTPSGAEAGQVFSLPYTIDEPEVTRARLFPAAGPAVELTIHADHVDGLLPPSIVGGGANVRLEVEDDVGNADMFELSVNVVSPIAAPSIPTHTGPGITPTGPAPRPAPDRRETQSGATWRIGRAGSSRSTSSSRSSVRLQSRATRYGVARSSSSVSWSASSSTSGATKLGIAVSTSTAHTRRRRDGPQEEAILLGVW